MKCSNCGKENLSGVKFCADCGTVLSTQSQPMPPRYEQTQGNEMQNIPPEYKPISMWGYFGYELLFAIPLVGFIVLLVFAFGGTSNKNVKNFARSYFCFLIIVAVLIAVIAIAGGLMFSMPGEGVSRKKDVNKEENINKEDINGVIFTPVEVKVDSPAYSIRKGWYEYEYDAAGNVTKQMWYGENDFNSSKGGWWEYEYDAVGNKTKQILYNEEKKEMELGIKYEYDTIGSITKQTWYLRSDERLPWYSYEYEYDSAGNVTKLTAHDSMREEIANWVEYEYDVVSNVTKQTVYGLNGSLSGWYEYEYDVSGNVTKLTVYDSNGSLSGRYEYEYNDAGNVTKQIKYGSNGSISDFLNTNIILPVT